MLLAGVIQSPCQFTSAYSYYRFVDCWERTLMDSGGLRLTLVGLWWTLVDSDGLWFWFPPSVSGMNGDHATGLLLFAAILYKQ